MPTNGKLNLLLTNSIYLVLYFSKKAKKTHSYQIILQVSLICLKINVSQTFVSQTNNTCKKNFLPSVYVIGKACFDECFLFQ